MHLNTQLSSGCIEDIMNDGKPDNPIVQVLGFKKIAGGASSGDRYRLMISDGLFSLSSCMLATQLNGLIDNGELANHAVVKLQKYLCNVINEERKVVIVLEIKVEANLTEKIGNPQVYKLGQPRTDVSANTNGNGQASVAHAPPPPSRPAPMPVANNNNFIKKPSPQKLGGTPSKVHPINSLTPYQNRWQIKARCSAKSAIKNWSNKKGDGKLFSMNFLDESGEIRATAFNQECDKFYDMIEIGKVYFVSKGMLKAANKQYSNVQNDYEMTFNRDTIITPCNEDDVKLPSLSFNFVDIEKLGDVAPQELIDVIGVVKVCNDLGTVTAKASNKEIVKRELLIVDRSKGAVNLTLWGTEAENFDGSNNPIVAVKGARVSDFGGRSLSVSMNSQLIINPNIQEANSLRGWYDSKGKDEDFTTFKSDGPGGSSNQWKILSELKNGNIGAGDKPDIYNTTATVIFYKKDNCMYTACPTDNCNKKVIDQGNGSYRCEKCNAEYTHFKWRMLLQCNIADHSDNAWVTCFQDTAQGLLHKTADELGHIKDSDEVAFENVFQDAVFKKYQFKLRSKMETYNDESRLKTIAMSATPINNVEYGKNLIQQIKELSKQL